MDMRDLDIAVKKLGERLNGEVLVPDDAGYEHARTIFNTMIEKRPAVIAQCETVDDVASVIRFGREHGLEIAVRGGGHSVAGMSLTEGGIVIDLRRMNAVTVDPHARTVNVGGGAVMSDLDRATEPHELVTTGGRVSTTGVGGLILGGGNGWLDRKFGLITDNLLAVELVTADGELVRASDEDNPELFWALHGGGGNFGVAVSFTLRLYPLPSIAATLLQWEPAAASEVIRAYRDFLNAAPDEVGGAILFNTGGDADWVAEHLRGAQACTAVITYAGGAEEARQAMAPMLELGHASELSVEVPYAELQSMLDDPPGYRNYWSEEHLDELPDAAIELFCSRASEVIVPSPSALVLVPQGGAVGRGPSDYPIPWRQAPWVVFAVGMWSDPADDERVKQWTRDVRADVRPWSSGTVYLNWIGDEGHDRVLAGLGPHNYARLASVKAQYDPENVFHMNHNIVPA